MVYHLTSIPESALHFATNIGGMTWSALKYLHSTKIAYVAYHLIVFCVSLIAGIIPVTSIPRQDFRLKTFHMLAIGKREDFKAIGFFDAQNLQRAELVYSSTDTMTHKEVDIAFKFAARYISCISISSILCVIGELTLPSIGMLPEACIYGLAYAVVILSRDLVHVAWFDMIVDTEANSRRIYTRPVSMIEIAAVNVRPYQLELMFMMPVVVIMRVNGCLCVYVCDHALVV